MVDFRYPSPERSVRFDLPHPVDDFRCFGGSIYAACTDTSNWKPRIQVYRCNSNEPGLSECLCTVVEDYDSGGRSPREDLKVFSICPKGFALSYGDKLATGTVSEPRWQDLADRDYADARCPPTRCLGTAQLRAKESSSVVATYPEFHARGNSLEAPMFENG
ncbi:unnamed protein product [Polarella glacialis]|uniref:Uncharacterized protein n=1 Tax=Polarella glacialis TaxID=89957 RepID=A0A813FB40_POLGL|nr:unnamed protein product [Polarella glacialis]